MTRQHRLLSLCGFILGFLPATAALAVGDLEIATTGQAANSITLELTDEGGNVTTLTSKEEDRRCRDERQSTGAKDDDRNRCGLLWLWGKKNPGTYTLRVFSAGIQIGFQTIVIKDGQTTRYNVDGATGRATLATPTTTADSQSQQQDTRFWLGFGVGYADANNVNGMFTSLFGNGGGDLNSNSWKGGLEFQWVPSRPQRLGNFYLYGRVYSLNVDATGYFVNAHPGPALDSGVSNKFEGEATVGAGWRLHLTNEVGVALFVGLAMTRIKTTVTSDERTGGGPLNTATNSKTSVGANWGLEASIRKPIMGTPVEFFLRGEQIYYESNDATVRSPFTGATYWGGINSGHINQFTVGARIGF